MGPVRLYNEDIREQTAKYGCTKPQSRRNQKIIFLHKRTASIRER